ncbi:hypothetical protein BDM02DRAFT_3184368 [Thelephora ganbajun]|uniref:Uncharacterized protein n=1 Tax=Thelephora ganbajun TaxID=370292 RepID=A0ACB6ZPQ0_THEGA|nr:hypothetical protein BDM02DRAFT_3184368 [Thelephora ganbajun]
MLHLSQATSQSADFIRRCGHADASGRVSEPAVISGLRCVDRYTTVYHRSRTSSVPDIPDSPASSCGEYSSASDWLKRKNFGTSGHQRSDSHLSQRRRSSTAAPYQTSKAHHEKSSPESIDAWFKQHFEASGQQVTLRQVRDNTLRHLEYPSYPSTFHIYFRGQPGISIQALLSKWRFDRSDIPLGRLINFRLVNPPLPDGAFAQRTVGGIKISDSMTIYEFCAKITGKIGTSLDQWDAKDLAMVSLELAQDSVICLLGTAHCPLVK